MASRIKLKLPSFSITKRSTSGRVSHHFVPRGCDSVLNPDNSGSLNPDDSDSVELTRGLPILHSFMWETLCIVCVCIIRMASFGL